jgi:hypothetical protein
MTFMVAEFALTYLQILYMPLNKPSVRNHEIQSLNTHIKCQNLLVCGHPFYIISTKYAILHQQIAPSEQKLFQMYKYELPLCTPKFPTCNPVKHNLQETAFSITQGMMIMILE